MTDRAINPDALVAVVNTLADELEGVLALGADLAAMGAMNDLADRLNELTFALTYAEAAGRILGVLQDRLLRWSRALAEVHNLPWDAVNSVHAYPLEMILREYGARFSPAGPCASASYDTDEDMPF